MNILIVEDETAAARGLEAQLARVLPSARVAGVTESVDETVEWLAANERPDLVFMDIHLADGESFRIFDRTEIAAPIVFTTAYDQHALEAFRVGGIDYLLKPIREEDLRRAVEKLRRLSATELAAAISGQTERVTEARHERERAMQRTFLIPVRDRIVPLRVEEVAFFHTSDERVRAYDFRGGSLPMDRSLDRLGKALSGDDFFRANRQFIVSRAAVRELSVWFGSRLSLALSVPTPERIVISKDRVSEFKRWFTKK